VCTYSFTDVEITPQAGQAAAVSSAVLSRTSRCADAETSTASTASPSRSSRSVASPAPDPAQVVSWFKPVVLASWLA
jgi:hypothetical protein